MTVFFPEPVTILFFVIIFCLQAQLLTRVHHRHLVPLIGYCNDDRYMALVYEYMHEGSLEDHMRGFGSFNNLNFPMKFVL